MDTKRRIKIIDSVPCTKKESTLNTKNKDVSIPNTSKVEFFLAFISKNISPNLDCILANRLQGRFLNWANPNKLRY